MLLAPRQRVNHHILTAPAFRMTRAVLGGAFGTDKKHELVVGLEAGDIISFRPARTQRKVTATAVQLYRAVLQWQANVANLEKARARKAALALQRERRSIARAEARLIHKARTDRS